MVEPVAESNASAKWAQNSQSSASKSSSKSGALSSASKINLEHLVSKSNLSAIPESQKPKKKINLRTGGADVENSAIARLVFSSNFEMCGGIVVLFNFLIITMETHAKATYDPNLLVFVMWMNRILLGYYSTETSIRMYVERYAFFKHGWNILDFVIVFMGVCTELLATIGQDSGGLEQASMLKSLRMLRLLRLVRLLVAFPELYVLVVGIARCVKTLAWAGLLIFIVLNSWAILSVEYLDILVKELDDLGMYPECPWCRHSFKNVWHANFTWFSIITGDGWSELARPLVIRHPWSYVFFVTCIFLVVWGLLNIIVAAIVDSSIAARQADVKSAAIIADDAEKETWDMFEELCQAMDVDGSGEITVDEFKNCWQKSQALQDQLKIMGVQEKEMDGLLRIMDIDGSGTLDHNEFVEQFTRMRTLVVKTTIFYLLKYVQDVHRKMVKEESTLEKLSQTVAALARKTGTSLCTDIAPPHRADGAGERPGGGSVGRTGAALDAHRLASQGQPCDDFERPHTRATTSTRPMHSPPSHTDLMSDDPPSTWSADENVAWPGENNRDQRASAR